MNFEGIKIFIFCFFKILKNEELFSWYKKTAVKSFLISFVILLASIASGAWFIATLGSSWVYDVGAVLWILALIYFSGAITLAVMSLAMSFVLDEEKLFQILSRQNSVKLRRAKVKDLLSEYRAALRTFFVAAISLPLFLVPPLVPVAVALLAWALGLEALSSAERILNQAPTHESPRPPSNLSLAVGIGFFPALAAFVPVLGTLLWPMLIVAALQAKMPTEALSAGNSAR